MPAAEMTRGVTIGERRSPVARRRAGMARLASPMAASVPRAVASTVAALPMSRLFARARRQTGSPATSRYHRSENASASRRSIPSVNVKYGSALKLRGSMTTSGTSRNAKIAPVAVR